MNISYHIISYNNIYYYYDDENIYQFLLNREMKYRGFAPYTYSSIGSLVLVFSIIALAHSHNQPNHGIAHQL